VSSNTAHPLQPDRGVCVAALYNTEQSFLATDDALALPALGGEVIYSDPRSPASRITKRLSSFGTTILTDTVLGTPFRYATEGFFQVNLPVYEHALLDMREWVEDKPVVDLYSGVGSIGLTIGGSNVTLVEVNEDAVREMRANIHNLEREDKATAVLAASEKALDYIRVRRASLWTASCWLAHQCR
jgi:tRNA/tmRNA/rRNA uracil-C5-methylase (TrmA/RlmC/RlmD family)